MLTVWNRHFECVLASDGFALPPCDLLEFPLSNVFELCVYIHDLLFFFLFGHRTTSFPSFDFRKSIYFPLHSVDLKGATDILL